MFLARTPKDLAYVDRLPKADSPCTGHRSPVKNTIVHYGGYTAFNASISPHSLMSHYSPNCSLNYYLILYHCSTPYSSDSHVCSSNVHCSHPNCPSSTNLLGSPHQLSYRRTLFGFWRLLAWSNGVSVMTLMTFSSTWRE